MTRRKSDSRSEATVTESNLIYHYTSVDSLKGIVEGNCFWASDLNAVNDPAELIHVRTSLSNICRTLGRCAQEVEDYNPFEQYVFEVGEELSTLEREHDWVDLA